MAKGFDTQMALQLAAMLADMGTLGAPPESAQGRWLATLAGSAQSGIQAEAVKKEKKAQEKKAKKAKRSSMLGTVGSGIGTLLGGPGVGGVVGGALGGMAGGAIGGGGMDGGYSGAAQGMNMGMQGYGQQQAPQQPSAGTAPASGPVLRPAGYNAANPPPSGLMPFTPGQASTTYQPSLAGATNNTSAPIQTPQVSIQPVGPGQLRIEDALFMPDYRFGQQMFPG